MANYKEKDCVLCGRTYNPTSPKQLSCVDKMCKDELRRQAERARYKKSKKRYSRECGFCGLDYITSDSRRVYCGLDKCEKYRQQVKNKRADKKRKGKRSEEKRTYYIDNGKLIKQKKKVYYREVLHPDRDVVDGWSTEKLLFKEVSSFVSGTGYTMLSTHYENTHTKIDLLCPVGHTWSTSLHNFKDCGNECPKCVAKRTKSKPEEELYNFVCSLVGEKNVIGNDRELISPYELDIFIPSKNLAIEYCGLYWHSEVAGNKPRNYHYNKMVLCNEKNVRLITIFEDEYKDKPDVVLSRIQNALGIGLKRIYARKCEVREIETKESKEFLLRNHLQGSTGARIKWGLFYEGELIQVLTAGLMSRTHTGKLKGCPDAKLIELKRFASKEGVSVVGGASKLFKRLKDYAKENGFTHIKSYCDTRYSNIVPVYEKIGFKLLTLTKWTPHYTRGGCRFRNQGLRKTPEERLTGLTEWELRKAEGYDRIYDTGHKTYTYEL